MAQSSQYLSQLESLNKQLASMTPANAEDAMADVSARVGNFAPQYAELRGLEQQAMSTPAQMMGDYLRQFGGTSGLSAIDRLGGITNRIGQIYGTRGAFADSLAQGRGRLEDILKGALGQYQAQRENVQQQYQNTMPLYQSALQQEEARRARAAARGIGGGGFDFSSLLKNGNTPTQGKVLNNVALTGKSISNVSAQDRANAGSQFDALARMAQQYGPDVLIGAGGGIPGMLGGLARSVAVPYLNKLFR